jgi:hypothetical protein
MGQAPRKMSVKAETLAYTAGVVPEVNEILPSNNPGFFGVQHRRP